MSTSTLTRWEHHSFHGTHYHDGWNAVRRATFCLWLLPVLAMVLEPRLAANHTFSMVAVGLCAFVLLVNFPQLTNMSLRPKVRFTDVMEHPRARKAFTAISVVLISIYVALLFGVVFEQYGEVGQFTQLPFIFQVILVRVTLTTCMQLHRRVSSLLLWAILFASQEKPQGAEKAREAAPRQRRPPLPWRPRACSAPPLMMEEECLEGPGGRAAPRLGPRQTRSATRAPAPAE